MGGVLPLFPGPVLMEVAMPVKGEITERIERERDMIQLLLDQGKSYRDIGSIYGCSHALVQNVMTGRHRKARRQEINRRKNAETTGFSPSQYIGHVEKVVVRGELPPPDTRDLTARILGDPLPGRSYLDRKKQQEQLR